MKFYKYILALIITVTGVLNFASCSDDGYDLGNFTVSLATVNPIDTETGTYYLTLDNGATLWPAASNVNYSPKANQRVVVNYTLLSDQVGEYDHYVKINGLDEILTKDIINLTPENEEEVGNDLIKILDMWTGDDYLNIHFRINIGGSITHTINLVQNQLEESGSQSEENVIELELRHNANGDTEKYSITNYAAFDLRPFKATGAGSVKLVIKAKESEEDSKTYTVTYNFNGSTAKLNNNITGMPDMNTSLLK